MWGRPTLTRNTDRAPPPKRQVMWVVRVDFCFGGGVAATNSSSSVFGCNCVFFVVVVFVINNLGVGCCRRRCSWHGGG